MHILLAIIGVAFLSLVYQVYFNGPPLIARLQKSINQSCGTSYLRLFGLPFAFTVGVYVLASAVAGPFIGLATVYAELGTCCGVIVLLGMAICFKSFIGNLSSFTVARISGQRQKASGEAEPWHTAVFQFGMYGMLGLVASRFIATGTIFLHQ